MYKRQVFRSVDVTVSERSLQVRRDLTAPLAFSLIRSGFDCLLDLGDGFLIILVEDAGYGILRFASVDGVRLPQVCLLYTSIALFIFIFNSQLDLMGNWETKNRNP